MYPNLYYAFKEIFGIDLPALRIINSFGFFVALSFLFAAFFFIKELKRKQAAGIFTYKEVTITVGEGANPFELIINFVLGFIFGFKIIGIFLAENALNDPQSYLFSSKGSFAAGLLVAFIFAGLKWWEKNKKKLAKPEQRKIRVWPSDRVGDIVIIAAISGFIGAKIFDSFQHWDSFIQDPIGSLFSPSGLTFYGGLILAIFTLWYYFKKKNIRFIDIADAAAPPLMLAYGVGRMGCQVAGDGDWGIVNSAFVSDTTGKIHAASQGEFLQQLNTHSQFYAEQFGSVTAVQHAAAKPVLGLPDWFFAYTYPHNVNEVGVNLSPCTWDKFCTYLPLPVFPTPLYEIITCLLLFVVLWLVRKQFKTPGRMFGFYLILNGIERFLIEKIRVTSEYNIFGLHPTQAQIIAVLLICTGLLLMILPKKTASKHLLH